MQVDIVNAFVDHAYVTKVNADFCFYPRNDYVPRKKKHEYYLQKFIN